MTWVVHMIESERGWGQRVDETIEFGSDAADREKAVAYVKDYNTKYNSDIVTPDWYMYADGPHWVDK